jgi:hypothetical protein
MLSGIPGDPVSGGLSLIIAGSGGANNQISPSSVSPLEGSTGIYEYKDNPGEYGAVRTLSDPYKAVYFAFGFEAISGLGDTATRAEVLQSIMKWFDIAVSVKFALFEGYYVPGEGIHLNWSVSHDLLGSKYNVYRQLISPEETGEYSRVHGKPLSTTSFVDSDVKAHSHYRYKIGVLSQDSDEESFSQSIVVSTSVIPTLPETIRLDQNHPNPFNPSTTLRFQLPEYKNHVTLKIFDTEGRSVRILFDGPKEAGFHTLRWDGLNERGENVASGIYYLWMDTGDYTDVKKMLLLK